MRYSTILRYLSYTYKFFETILSFEDLPSKLDETYISMCFRPCPVQFAILGTLDMVFLTPALHLRSQGFLLIGEFG